MSYQPLERLLPRAGKSIYQLVLLAAKRATELAEGMPKLIERPLTIKTTTLALDEILEGKVVMKGYEDQLEKGQAEQPAKEKKAHKEKKEK
jgi:DNA-directed RNA polymerase omega subunit